LADALRKATRITSSRRRSPLAHPPGRTGHPDREKFLNFVQDRFSIAPQGCFGNNSGVQLFRRPSKPLPDSAPEREDKIRFASDEVVRKAARRVFTKYKLTMRKLAE
jgi:hypothetical protein